MRIVAIGGGNLLKNETLRIDKYLVKLTKKKNPRVLLIPTASNDSSYFIRSFKKIYGKKLSCEVDDLNLIKNKLTKKEISHKILSPDLIYVGDGNPNLLYKTWEKYGVDKLLRIASKRGIILSGKSSGAICWAKEGLGSRKARTYKGFAFTKLNFVAHFSKKHYDVIFKNFRKLGKSTVALQDGAAIEIFDSKYRILSSLDNAKAYKLELIKNKVIQKEIHNGKKFRNIDELL